MLSTNPNPPVTATLLRLLFILAALWSLLWPSASYAQPASAPVISAPVTPLRVIVDLESLLPVSQGPMVTVPEGETLPTTRPAPSQPMPDGVIQLEEGYGGKTTEGLSDPSVNVSGHVR